MLEGRTLYIDAGNSRLKYEFGAISEPLPDSASLRELVARLKPVHTIISSVTGTSEDIHDLTHAHYVEVENDFIGLRLAYSDPALLGVDRWLSMLAAREMSPEAEYVCVVSAGTALTVDVVSRQSNHLGGAIAPGLRLGLSALNSQTHQLPLVSLQSLKGLGKSTNECINYGILKSAEGLIRGVVNQLPDSRNVKVLISGGDRDYLGNLLGDLECELIENLVIIGLKFYWQHKQRISET